MISKQELWKLRTPLPAPEPPTPDPPGQFCVTRDLTRKKPKKKKR